MLCVAWYIAQRRTALSSIDYFPFFPYSPEGDMPRALLRVDGFVFSMILKRLPDEHRRRRISQQEPCNIIPSLTARERFFVNRTIPCYFYAVPRTRPPIEKQVKNLHHSSSMEPATLRPVVRRAINRATVAYINIAFDSCL